MMFGELERLDERVADVRSPGRAQVLDVYDCGLAVFLRVGQQLGFHHVDRVAVGDEREPVVGVQAVDNELERALGLLDLLAVHAAGPVDDADEVLRDDRALVELGLRRGEQQEVTGPVRVGPIADDRRADLALRRRVIEPVVDVGLRVALGPRRRGAVVGEALDAHVVRW